jgi:hypothetical protein
MDFSLRSLFPLVSSQISLAASSAVKAMERTELLLPQVVQDDLNNRLHKFMSSLQNPEFNRFNLKGNMQSHASSHSSNLHIESSESQMA